MVRLTIKVDPPHPPFLEYDDMCSETDLTQGVTWICQSCFMFFSPFAKTRLKISMQWLVLSVLLFVTLGGGKINHQAR